MWKNARNWWHFDDFEEKNITICPFFDFFVFRTGGRRCPRSHPRGWWSRNLVRFQKKNVKSYANLEEFRRKQRKISRSDSILFDLNCCELIRKFWKSEIFGRTLRGVEKFNCSLASHRVWLLIYFFTTLSANY